MLPFPSPSPQSVAFIVVSSLSSFISSIIVQLSSLDHFTSPPFYPPSSSPIAPCLLPLALPPSPQLLVPIPLPALSTPLLLSL